MSDRDLDALTVPLANHDADRAVAALARATSADAVAIRNLLVETSSQRVRNAAALALVDLRDGAAVALLQTLLQRAEIAPGAGTLIFALDELGGSLPLAALLTMVRHGSYEAQAEALLLAEAGRLCEATADAVRAADRELAALVRGADERIAPAAAAARDRLGATPAPAEARAP